MHPAQPSPPPERSTMQVKPYFVPDECAVSIGFEPVGVNPALKRAPNLSIYEPIGWFPVVDLRTPPHREMVQPQRVINERARRERLGGNSPDTKMEKRRCDSLQIVGCGEEGIHLVHRVRDAL